MSISIEQARRAKEALREQLEGSPEFLGLGITKIGDDYAVKVNFEKEPSEPPPRVLNGVPIQVEIVGKIRKRK